MAISDLAPSPWRRSMAAVASGCLLLTGCDAGQQQALLTTDEQPAVATADDDPAVTVSSADGVAVEVASTERIIPLDGDVAEIVFALGLGDRVVATDLSATHPPEADALPEIGYQRALSAEPIVGFDPTVLLATDLAGPPETLEQLRDEFDIPLVSVPSPNNSTGPAVKIRAVAAALGVPERGERLAARVQQRVDDAIALATRQRSEPSVVALYLRGETAQLVLGDDSAIGWMLDAAGARDLGSELGDGSSFPIEPESLVAAAPDALVVTKGGLASVGGMEGLLELPGVAGTPAARDGRVLAYDDQLLLGNGPRTGEVLEQLVRDLHQLPPG